MRITNSVLNHIPNKNSSAANCRVKNTACVDVTFRECFSFIITGGVINKRELGVLTRVIRADTAEALCSLLKTVILELLQCQLTVFKMATGG